MFYGSRHLVIDKIFDVFLGVPKRDWSAEGLAREKLGREAAKAEAQQLENSRASNTKPSLPLAAYTGTYTGAMYGDAKVTEENGTLVVRLMASPNFVGDIEHWHFDTFSVKWRGSIVYPFGRGFVSFVIDPKAKVAEMKIDVPNPDFDFKELEFKRVPEVKN